LGVGGWEFGVWGHLSGQRMIISSFGQMCACFEGHGLEVDVLGLEVRG
jgi:hypothetical protein